MKKNSLDINQHLTQLELLDYTNGVLGNEEMYRLELHLNECELCSDALDGMALVKNSEKILGNLSNKIAPAKQKRRGINYMAIAASVALIAVFSFSYWLLTKPANNTIALNEPTKAVKEAPAPLLEAIEEPIDVENEIEEPASEISNTETTSTSNSTTVNKPLVETSKQMMAIKPKEIEPVDYPNPLPAVAGQDLTENDEGAIVEEESFYEPTDANAAVSLSEVVTQSAPRKSKRLKKTEAKSPNTLQDQKEPLPVGGMEVLKSYINQNLQYPQKALDNNIKGTVVLEVSINNDGSVNTISVVKGLGFGCDAEAMRLIANGPKWTPKVENGQATKATQQVKIKFKK
ncbi:MAG: TonB family protein [Cyclobacteriaceae bacterium]|nr:TonB family protein [Cyclobacteriaceae bacterium]